MGRKLIRAAEEALRESGFSEAMLWVLEQNPRARRFYEAGGWRAAASRPIEVLGVVAPEVQYRKRLYGGPVQELDRLRKGGLARC